MRYESKEIRTIENLADVLDAARNPVLLVEGIRALPDKDRQTVFSAGRMLAEGMPTVIFRSGNAEGTDTAFAEGVTAVAPERMEYVTTHPGMGRKRRHPLARLVSLDSISDSEGISLDRHTVSASSEAERLVKACRDRDGAGALAARAKYLLRDTLKVVGSAELRLFPATAAVFYANEADPLSGGTGHTIRVCYRHDVPVVMQSVWRHWLALREGRR